MKKITLVLAVLAITIVSFTNSPNPSYSGSFVNKEQMLEFVKSSGAQIVATGKFKYWQVETTVVSEKEVLVKVTGSNKLLFSSEWSGCGQIYYGGINNTYALDMATAAQVAAYEDQGYNCVCTESWDNYYPGEFPGHQTCTRVTATTSTLCGCLIH